jgi:cell division protein FtsB
MSKLAIVKDGTVEISGKIADVGSRLWHRWLEHPETKSFRVDDGDGYTARKETVKGYWYAYRKVEGKLHKRYIGLSEALTLERLAEVGKLFDIPTQPKLPKSVGNLTTNNTQKLPKSVGNLEEILQQRIQQLENDGRNLEEILQNRLLQLDAAHDDFCKQTVVIKNLQNENAELRRENTELFNEKIDKSLELSNMLLAKQKEVETFIDNQKLHRELGNLQVENEALKAEIKAAKKLAEVRAQVSTQTAPQNSPVLELPEAATLLNQLKAFRKKSKTDLQDVEVILELLPETLLVART